MARKKKNDPTPSSYEEAQEDLDNEVAKLQQLQAEWKQSHVSESSDGTPPQTPAQKRRQERIARRRARQQKAIADVAEFIEYQQTMLAQKWKELGLSVGERKKLTRMKREKRIAARKARQNTRKEATLEWKSLRKQNRDERAESVQSARQDSKDNIIEVRAHRIEKKEHAQQFREESKSIRKRNWQQYVRRRRRRTKRFMKFRHRLWWKGYLTFLAWILSIFLILVGIFYLFKALGINLIDVFQNL